MEKSDWIILLIAISILTAGFICIPLITATCVICAVLVIGVFAATTAARKTKESKRMLKNMQDWINKTE